MLERLKAFFARRSDEQQEQLEEEYTTMTPEEREGAEAGWSRGARGEADEQLRREADRGEDPTEGRPPVL